MSSKIKEIKLEPGWLEKQIAKTQKEIQSWPEQFRRQETMSDIRELWDRRRDHCIAEMEILFEKYTKTDYLRFDLIENNLSEVGDNGVFRADLHAFLLLEKICGKPFSETNIIDYAEHDVLWLATDVGLIAALADADQIQELVRCGIRYDNEKNKLFLYMRRHPKTKKLKKDAIPWTYSEYKLSPQSMDTQTRYKVHMKTDETYELNDGQLLDTFNYTQRAYLNTIYFTTRNRKLAAKIVTLLNNDNLIEE